MEWKDRVIKPYTPVEVEETHDEVKVGIVGRKYVFGYNSLPKSIITKGKEILVSPMRIIAKENGKDLVFTTNELRLFSNSEEQATIVGSMQGEAFIVNTNFRVEYDGYTYIDLKVMPRGRSVAEEHTIGLGGKGKQFSLEQLWLEIPLKTENSFLYHFHKNGPIYREDNTIYKEMEGTDDWDNISGQWEENVSYHLPYKGLFWLGDDERGIGFVFPSDENLQPIEENRFFEIINRGEERILRLRFVDGMPKSWEKQIEEAGKNHSDLKENYIMFPICYSFGMQVTPIKPFPKNPILHNAIHIDCFKKIDGDYIDFLANPVVEGDTEIGYDRLKRLGVTTLILHEKWNNMQNYPVLTKFSQKQIRTIVRECHARGIKVLPYFGYELSTFAPDFKERYQETITITESGTHGGGWWRVPPQRAYWACYNSSYRDFWLQGVKNLIETYHFDGVYLDGTIHAGYKCTNALHGCGYTDINGKRCGTYPFHGVRKLIKQLYSIVEPLGGIINCHDSSMNFSAMGFSHLMWQGELFQVKFMHNGGENFPADFLRAECTGRNFGVPTELLVYQNRPIWTFEHATALALVHGILPRPNDIGFPLEFISKIWEIIDVFPMEKSKFIPYWENTEIFCDNENVKCSYYEYKDVLGKKHLLLMVSNLSTKEIRDAHFTYGSHKITFLNGTASWTKEVVDFEKYTYFIASADEE